MTLQRPPIPQAPLVDEHGYVTREWWRWFSLVGVVAGASSSITDITAITTQFDLPAPFDVVQPDGPRGWMLQPPLELLPDDLVRLGLELKSDLAPIDAEQAAQRALAVWTPPDTIDLRLDQASQAALLLRPSLGEALSLDQVAQAALLLQPTILEAPSLDQAAAAAQLLHWSFGDALAADQLAMLAAMLVPPPDPLRFSSLSGKIAASQCTVPQVTVYTSGSGTYATPAGALYIVVDMAAGGGGGGGTDSTSGGTAGTAGGNSTFGTALLTCNGGARGNIGGGTSTGGTATGGDVNLQGGDGANVDTSNALVGGGGMGGGTPWGQGGAGGAPGGNPGAAAHANSGAGGGGGSTGSLTSGIAQAGAAGGWLRKLITSPAASYSYAVAAGGTGGTGGTNGGGGGAGAAGMIVVTAYFQ